MAVSGYTQYGSRTTWSGSEATTISPGSSGNTGQLIRNTSWSNFVFECDDVNSVLDRSGTYGAIIFRRTSLSAYYAVTYQYLSGTNPLRFKSNNFANNNTTGQIAYAAAPYGSNPSMKIQMIGNACKIWMGFATPDDLLIDTTDSTHASGTHGFAYGPNWEIVQTWSGVSWSPVGGVVQIIGD